VQLFYLGRRKEALALVRVFTKETTLPDGSPDDARRGLSPGALVTASLYAGRLDEHLERLEDAVRAFRAIGDVRSECLYGSAIGFALSQLGAYDRAERRLRRTVDIARKSGVPVLLPLTLHNLGEVLSHDRRTLREALDVESQAVDELRAEGESRFLAGSLAYRARIHVGLGELDAAERDAREALAVGASNDGLRALLFGTLADVMLARGRNDEALASARTAADAVKKDAPAEAGDALAMATLVRALEATGAHEEARSLARVAWRDIVRRSKRIASPALRASFLRRVPEHRVIMDAT
jgi:tetratricopeptide (TPR) repeat protein